MEKTDESGGIAYRHVTHGAEVVDLVRLDGGDDVEEIGRVREVSIVEEYLHASVVSVSVDVLNARGIEGRASSHDPMHFIAFPKQKLSQIRSILTGYPCNQSSLCLCRLCCRLLFLRCRHNNLELKQICEETEKASPSYRSYRS